MAWSGSHSPDFFGNDSLRSRGVSVFFGAVMAICCSAPAFVNDTTSSAVDLSGRFSVYANSAFGGSSIDGEPRLSGRLDAFLTLDGERAGLWEGFSIYAHAEAVFGEAFSSQIGSVWPVNQEEALPRVNGSDATLSVLFTQRFSPNLQASFGVFDFVEIGDRGLPLQGGGGNGTFLYTGIAVPPSFLGPPYVLGGRVSYAAEPFNFNFMIYDPRNVVGTDIFDDPFQNGLNYNFSATRQVSFNGLSGFYTLNLVHSTASGIDLETAAPDVIDGQIRMIDGKSYAAFKFQQYLVRYGPDATKGWGVFGHVGIGDGNPLFLDSHYLLGIGGDSPINGRADDRWGIAASRYNWSNSLIAALGNQGVSLRDESVIEAFYEAAITDNARLGINYQRIRAGLEQTDWIDTLGVRLRFTF